MIADEVLEQVERVAAAATPGTWVPSDAAGVVVAHAKPHAQVVLLAATVGRATERAAADLEIAALGRNLLPALVAEIRRLRAELATTDAALQACRALEDGPVVLRIPAGAKLPPGLQTGMVLLDSDEQEEPARDVCTCGRGVSGSCLCEVTDGPDEEEAAAREKRAEAYAAAMAAIHARYPEQEDAPVEPEPASYANQPIGTCERCSMPVYITGGFCGVCNPGLL